MDSVLAPGAERTAPKIFPGGNRISRTWSAIGFYILSIALFSAAEADVSEVWVNRYDYQGKYDFARALAIDSAGNVVVSGHHYEEITSENFDFVTVKYDARGNALWASRYDDGGADVMRAVAVDDEDNVIVTGSSIDGVGDYDYLTVKYDANGRLIWHRQYDSGGTDDAAASGVDADGNVYVTGSSGDADHGSDFVTLKYDSEGNEVWARTYDHGADDRAVGLVVDAADNVIVTGASDDPESSTDFATVKYDTHGNELWVTRYDDGGVERPSAIDVDHAGNIYVTRRRRDRGHLLRLSHREV